MHTITESITPNQARLYLQLNTRNRPLKKGVVDQYAKDMKAGNWRLTHQGIAFGENNELLDGQNRLHAIIQSGVTVLMQVSRMVPSDSQLVMDDHSKRSAGDALSLIRNEKIVSWHIAVIRGAVELTGGRNVKTARLTKNEMDKVFDTFRGPIDFLSRTMPTNERGVTSSPVKASVALAWFYVKDLARLEAFCDVLTGRTLAESGGDRAAVILREWLLRNGMQSSDSRAEGFKKTQRAIVAFSERKDVGKLIGTSVYFPWPLIEPVRGTV